MSFITTTLRGTKIEFRYCTPDDIHEHFKKIEDVIEPENQEEHEQRMLECVLEKTAFVTASGNCFLYYKKTKPKFADGVALEGRGHPMEMIALLSGIFRSLDDKTWFVYFKLHSNKFINEYKGLMSKSSIHRHLKSSDPILVRTDKLLAKFDRHTFGEREWA